MLLYKNKKYITVFYDKYNDNKIWAYEIVEKLSEDEINEIYPNKELYLSYFYIGNEFVNLYLTDSNDNALNGFTNNKLPTYSSLSVIDDLPDSKLLYSGIIKSNSSMKLKLRAWVSDLYSLGNDNKCISFDIYVRSI